MRPGMAGLVDLADLTNIVLVFLLHSGYF